MDWAFQTFSFYKDLKAIERMQQETKKRRAISDEFSPTCSFIASLPAYSVMRAGKVR